MARRLISLIPAAILLLACERKAEIPPPATKPPVAVEVAPVQTAPVSNDITATGVLRAADEQRLSFKVGGVLASLAVEAGQRVRAGQVLAALDATEVAASVSQARAQRDKAERDFARAQALFRDDVIPKAERDDAETARDVARAQLRAIDFNKDFSRILASADGVVLRTFVESREIVSAGQPILVLASHAAQKRIAVALSDRDALQIRVDDAAQVRFDALPELSFNARVQTLAGAANLQTGLFEIELALQLDDPEIAARLTSGLVAKVRITPSMQSAAAPTLAIPMGAIVEAKNHEARVFVTEGGKAKSRLIEIGAIEQGYVRVKSGLREGETLVVRGGAYLDEGAAVVVQTPGAAP